MLIAGSIMGIAGIVFAVPLAVIVAIVFSIPSPLQPNKADLQGSVIGQQKQDQWQKIAENKLESIEKSEWTPVAKNLEKELLKNKLLQKEKKMKKEKENEKIKNKFYDI